MALYWPYLASIWPYLASFGPYLTLFGLFWPYLALFGPVSGQSPYSVLVSKVRFLLRYVSNGSL